LCIPFNEDNNEVAFSEVPEKISVH